MLELVNDLIYIDADVKIIKRLLTGLALLSPSGLQAKRAEPQSPGAHPGRRRGQVPTFSGTDLVRGSSRPDPSDLQW